LYLEALPLFARGAVSLPNHSQLIRELRLLERRTHRSGKDSVDHGSGGSDDHANAVVGILRQLSRRDRAQTTISIHDLSGNRTSAYTFDTDGRRVDLEPKRQRINIIHVNELGERVG
jgi:hypothetical protein